MKRTLIFLLILLPLKNLYALTPEEIRSTLDKKGYVCSKEKILKKVLDLSKEEEETLLGMAVSDRAEKLDNRSAHQFEKVFRTGVVVVEVDNQEFISYIPKTNSPKADCKNGEQYLKFTSHTDEELGLIEKIGKRIARILHCKAVAVDIFTYEDIGKKRQDLSWHQDCFDGASDTDVLLFAILEREKCKTNLLSTSCQSGKHRKNFQRIGRIGEKHIHFNGFVTGAYENDVKECKKLRDQQGAGYFINQRHKQKGNDEMLVHSRDARICSSKRTSIVIRTTILDTKSAKSLMPGSKDASEKAFKDLYLSDSKIAKALCESRFIKNGWDMNALGDIDEKAHDANRLYYELMAQYEGE